MSYQGVRECVVCAWREGCRLKWRNEPVGALHCPEFTPDLQLEQVKAAMKAGPTGEFTKGDD